MGSRTLFRADDAHFPFVARDYALRQEKYYHDYVTASCGVAITAAGIF